MHLHSAVAIMFSKMEDNVMFYLSISCYTVTRFTVTDPLMFPLSPPQQIPVSVLTKCVKCLVGPFSVCRLMWPLWSTEIAGSLAQNKDSKHLLCQNCGMWLQTIDILKNTKGKHFWGLSITSLTAEFKQGQNSEHPLVFSALLFKEFRCAVEACRTMGADPPQLCLPAWPHFHLFFYWPHPVKLLEKHTEPLFRRTPHPHLSFLWLD